MNGDMSTIEVSLNSKILAWYFDHTQYVHESVDLTLL